MILGTKWEPELVQGTNEASFQEVIWSWKVKAEQEQPRQRVLQIESAASVMGPWRGEAQTQKTRGDQTGDQQTGRR